jgi:hypothetical protein
LAVTSLFAEAGWAGDNHKFLKNGSGLFSRVALEGGDDIEAVREIVFLAQVIFAFASVVNTAVA